MSADETMFRDPNSEINIKYELDGKLESSHRAAIAPFASGSEDPKKGGRVKRAIVRGVIPVQVELEAKLNHSLPNMQ